MKRALQILAAVIAIATATLWAAGGANTGWTKNKAQVKTIDPVTEIEQIEWKDGFIPGLDFFCGGLAAAAALVIASRFIHKTTNQ